MAANNGTQGSWSLLLNIGQTLKYYSRKRRWLTHCTTSIRLWRHHVPGPSIRNIRVKTVRAILTVDETLSPKYSSIIKFIYMYSKYITEQRICIYFRSKGDKKDLKSVFLNRFSSSLNTYHVPSSAPMSNRKLLRRCWLCPASQYQSLGTLLKWNPNIFTPKEKRWNFVLGVPMEVPWRR